MHTLLQLHMLAGGLAIITGGTALAATKGGVLHRKSGVVFVYAMLTMGISASILAFDKGGFTHPNFLGGFMAAYFVITASRRFVQRRYRRVASTQPLRFLHWRTPFSCSRGEFTPWGSRIS